MTEGRAPSTASFALHSAPVLAVLLLVTAYIAIFGTMALRRHQNLRTNALDLGYTDQAVWNTLHGRPFRFSTYLDAAFHLDIPIQDFRDPGMLLGYHVEPILAAISLLYLVHDGPESLLWLQTVAIALGAVPVYLLARRRFEPREASGMQDQDQERPWAGILRWLPLTFVLLYLLSPALQAANLSDFHTIALSPALLLAAFYFLETDHPWGFVLFAFLAAMTREEIGLVVAMMGLWAAFVRRRWALGLAVAILGAGWSLIAFEVILPYFNGLGSSAFTVRYGQFGDSPAGVLRNLVQQPHLFTGWLRRPEVLRYLRNLWLGSGGLAILYPLALAPALPSIVLNTFSRYAWMHSGGGHYSAAIVPFLVIAAIYGVDWLSRRISLAAEPAARWPLRRVVAVLLALLGLCVAIVFQHYNGVAPFSRRFVLEPVSEHAHRARPFIEQVNALPPGVPVSASTGLYPHVAHRQRVYLFPTVSDARFILLDVTGSPSPASDGDQYQIVRDLLDYAQFGVAGSDHGFLLLERGLGEYRFSPAFYDAYLANGAAPQVALSADFSGLLRLEGFDWEVRPVVRQELVVQITTYWQALAPLEEDYHLVFFFWDEQGNLVRVQPEQQVVHWFPTWLWEPGQPIRVTLPPLPVGDLAHVGVAVLRPGFENTDPLGRVVPIAPASGQDLTLWEQDTILELTRP